MSTSLAFQTEHAPLYELSAAEAAELHGGVPWTYIGYAVSAYLAKTVGDHWGDFKNGVAVGFTATKGAFGA